MKTIENGELVEDTGDNPDLEREFWAFRDELQQDQEAEGYIKVWKLPLDAQGKARSNSMQQSLLFETPIGESSIDDIIHRVRAEYMDPGEYRTTVCLRGYRRGHRGIRFSKIMAIERPREKAREQSQNGGQPGIADLLQIMTRNAEQQAARTEAFMREMMNMQRQQPVAAPASFDPVQMMGQVAAMMGVFQGMMGKMAPALPSPEAASPVKQLIETIQVMKQLKGAMGDGDGEKDSNVLSVIQALTPLAKPALELMAQNQRATAAAPAAPRRARAPAAPAIIPEPGAPVAASIENEDSDMGLAELREHLNSLCDYAAQDADPETVADLLMDILPEEFDARLSAMVTDPSTFQSKLSLILPRTSQHAVWFERLRVVLEADFTADPDAPDADEEDAEDHEYRDDSQGG